MLSRAAITYSIYFSKTAFSAHQDFIQVPCNVVHNLVNKVMITVISRVERLRGFLIASVTFNPQYYGYNSLARCLSNLPLTLYAIEISTNRVNVNKISIIL